MAFNLEKIANEKANSKQISSNLNIILKKEINLFGGKFSNKQKENFYTELSVLLKAGISLKDALLIIGENEKKERVRTFFDSIINDIIRGGSFSEVIKKNKEFSEYEYYSLEIGEETGMLPDITKELGSFFAKKNEQRRAMIAALTYPAIIFTTSVLVVVFMLRLVVPMFQDIFLQNNVELPWITKLIIKASGFIGDFGWIIFFLVFTIFALRKWIGRRKKIRQFKDKLMLKIPFLGSFYKSVYLSQFSQAISLLTFSKVPMLNSIQLVAKMVDFYPLQHALHKVEKGILKGNSLSTSMRDDPFFDQKIIALVKVAEETNQTDFIFSRLHVQYSIEVEQRSKILSTIMEPIIILIVGIMVGIILVAMYLPMFKISSIL
ncbi:type II secretion system F family protein [Galbibacter sp. BG1]|uniref:type II secretion system F family protein n=1 Tax=Galbibacter sp. BG1 TaxID=1170699 RepID=UPI0015B9D9C9|nr:type II secretion system F family protein [Galbibacter sp. BG1]QLE02054.1 type II secretion system F family protein [Galbibacter sp. BG1]